MDRILKTPTSPVNTPYGSIKEWYSPANTPVGTPGSENYSKVKPSSRDRSPDGEHMQRSASHDHEEQRDRFSNVSYEIQRSGAHNEQGDGKAEETKSLEPDATSSASALPFTKRQIFTLAVLSFSGVCSAMFGSLLAPFFPIEAKNKGISETWVGLIFGSYQLVSFLFSPLWGAYLTNIGAKFMYVAGIFVNSSCAILFGCLEWCPPGHVYIVMCLVTRSVEAAASAAIGTSSKAVATHAFPDRISTVIGILNACGCVGLMAGPPLGGILYQLGGFYLPFLVTGGGFMLCGFISWCFLPTPPAEDPTPSSQHSVAIPKWHLLNRPVVWVIGYIAFVGQFAMGYLDVTFTLHLQKVEPSLTQAMIGLIFLIAPVVVVLFAPIIGWLADKFKSLGRFIMVLGIAFAGLGLMGLGPSPFLTFLPQYSLAVVLTSLAVAGVGWAALVITYQEFVTAAKLCGFPDTLETQGLVSGVYNAYNSLGAFLGPVAGGYMNEKLHFEWCITINAFMILLSGVVLVIYMICEALGLSDCHRKVTHIVTVTTPAVVQPTPVAGVDIQTEENPNTVGTTEDNSNDTQPLIDKD